MKTFQYPPNTDELYYAVQEIYFEMKKQLFLYQKQFPNKKIHKEVNLWKKALGQYMTYFPEESIYDKMRELAQFKAYLKDKKQQQPKKGDMRILEFPEYNS